MKNTINRIITFLFLLVTPLSFAFLFFFSGLLSCVSMPKAVIEKTFPRVDSKPPVDAFGLVMTKSEIYADHCLPSPNFKACLDVVEKLPVATERGVGSGLLIKAKTKTIFLTAAHVCEYKNNSVYEASGIKIKLRIVNTIKIRPYTGEEINAKILKIDHENDLCALSIDKLFTTPVVWSSLEPDVGDPVYAISAPHGINSPTMNLIFSGYYSGFIGDIHHYTIPTRPGSSGSVVLNKNFRGIGMLNAAYINMESIGIGTGYLEIKSFLESI
jgi:S1-C subfamily serine protease